MIESLIILQFHYHANHKLKYVVLRSIIFFFIYFTLLKVKLKMSYLYGQIIAKENVQNKKTENK